MTHPIKAAITVGDALSFLQSNIEPADPTCRFKAALERALRLIKAAPEVDAMDLSLSVDNWPHIGDLLSRLTAKYADLLEITVSGEEDDFLLWNGVRVTESFADPTIEPDAEHLCIAILALEGLLPEIMSANWDGLIEKAAYQLSGSANLVSVRVLPDDVRQAGFRVHLYKFHGCAVLASQDEATYRPFLIARKSQIDDWDKGHSVFQQQLVNIVTSKATLMIGLSAQDSNIRSVFGRAREYLNWQWPGRFPAIVFSQPELGADQIVLLKSVYRNVWQAANRDQIQAESVIPTYGKQILLALVIRILCGKLDTLMRGADGLLPAAERDLLAQGLIVLRNMVADADTGSTDHYIFMRTLIQHVSRVMGLFRDGRAPANAQLYRPLTMSPAAHIPLDPGVPASGLQELAVAAATLGLGATQGLWTLHAADLTDTECGAFEIRTSIRTIPIFFAASAESALQLSLSGRLSTGRYAVVVHSKSVVEPTHRSSRIIRRTGVLPPRSVSMSDLLKSVSTTAELTQRFQREVAL